MLVMKQEVYMYRFLETGGMASLAGHAGKRVVRRQQERTGNTDSEQPLLSFPWERKGRKG